MSSTFKKNKNSITAGAGALFGPWSAIGTSMLGGLMGGEDKPALPPDPEKKAEEAAAEEARRLKRRKGMGSTILTSPQGVEDQPLGAA